MADALAFVIGQTKLVDLYMSGALCKDAEEEAAARGTAAGPSATDASRRNVEELALNQEQLTFEREISGRLDLARKANHSSDAEEAEEAREVAMDKNRPVICVGPPGTGKTTVVTKASRRPAACISRLCVPHRAAGLAHVDKTRQPGQGGRGTRGTRHSRSMARRPRATR